MNAEETNAFREQAEARIVALLLGEASPFEEAAIQELLQKDPSLAAFHQEMKGVLTLVKAASAKPSEAMASQPLALRLSSGRRGALLKRFKQPANAPLNILRGPVWRRRWFIPITVAASLVGMIGGLFWAIPHYRYQSVAKISVVNEAPEIPGLYDFHQTVPAGNTLDLKLPAGGRVAGKSAKGQEEIPGANEQSIVKAEQEARLVHSETLKLAKHGQAQDQQVAAMPPSAAPVVAFNNSKQSGSVAGLSTAPSVPAINPAQPEGGRPSGDKTDVSQVPPTQERYALNGANAKANVVLPAEQLRVGFQGGSPPSTIEYAGIPVINSELSQEGEKVPETWHFGEATTKLEPAARGYAERQLAANTYAARKDAGLAPEGRQAGDVLQEGIGSTQISLGNSLANANPETRRVMVTTDDKSEKAVPQVLIAKYEEAKDAAQLEPAAPASRPATSAGTMTITPPALSTVVSAGQAGVELLSDQPRSSATKNNTVETKSIFTDEAASSSSGKELSAGYAVNQSSGSSGAGIVTGVVAQNLNGDVTDNLAPLDIKLPVPAFMGTPIDLSIATPNEGAEFAGRKEEPMQATLAKRRLNESAETMRQSENNTHEMLAEVPKASLETASPAIQPPSEGKPVSGGSFGAFAGGRFDSNSRDGAGGMGGGGMGGGASGGGQAGFGGAQWGWARGNNPPPARGPANSLNKGLGLVADNNFAMESRGRESLRKPANEKAAAKQQVSVYSLDQADGDGVTKAITDQFATGLESRQKTGVSSTDAESNAIISNGRTEAKGQGNIASTTTTDFSSIAPLPTDGAIKGDRMVPVLGDVPVLGKLFRAQTETAGKPDATVFYDTTQVEKKSSPELVAPYALFPQPTPSLSTRIVLPAQETAPATDGRQQNVSSQFGVGIATSTQDQLSRGEKISNNAPAPVTLKAQIASEKYQTKAAELKAVAEFEQSKKAAAVEQDGKASTPKTPPPIPQPEVETRDTAFSTFSLTVSDVSFRLSAASLEKGVMPDPASIRSEEFVNAFDYRDPLPTGSSRLAFASEQAHYPFAHNREIIRLAIRTAATGRESGRPLNLVVLLDHSGSMERADRVAIVQEALKVLARQLQPQDRISIILFARTAELWMDGLPGDKSRELLKRLRELNPQGGTNLEEALNLAYATALRHFLATGNNRVVLMTDGAANLGDVDPESLQKNVEAHRKQGIALDCFGIGWEGYNDDLLEILSRHGDGRYGFLNSVEVVKSDFANLLAGALQVAAADVKAQVEFNPQRVTSFRQIGYARHQLTKEQFRDNTVDAAEIGAAETGNALYVIQVNLQGDGPLGVVRVRYKVPATGEYQELGWTLPFQGRSKSLDQASPSLRLAASAAAYAEWLANSPYAAEVNLNTLEALLNGVAETFAPDPRPQRLAWMIRQARSIIGK